ncbi:unnamed protein product, partial [Vitis vinifera]
MLCTSERGELHILECMTCLKKRNLPSRMVWLSLLLIHKKPQVTISRIPGIPAKIPVTAHPLAEEPVEIASNINYHVKYSLHFFFLPSGVVTTLNYKCNCGNCERKLLVSLLLLWHFQALQ